MNIEFIPVYRLAHIRRFEFVFYIKRGRKNSVYDTKTEMFTTLQIKMKCFEPYT